MNDCGAQLFISGLAVDFLGASYLMSLTISL